MFSYIVLRVVFINFVPPIAWHSISMREAYDNAMAYNKRIYAEEEEVLLVKEISYFKQSVLSNLMSKVQSKVLFNPYKIDFAMFFCL